MLLIEMSEEESNNSANWRIKCSQENLAECIGEWEPAPEEIERIYNLISKGGPYNLDWKCPGYRSLNSSTPSTPTVPTPAEPIETPSDKADDFDFMDEMSSPSLRVRREGETELKGSAKKKTTSLDGVLSNMRRHWRLQQMDKDTTSEPK